MDCEDTNLGGSWTNDNIFLEQAGRKFLQNEIAFLNEFRVLLGAKPNQTGILVMERFKSMTN